MSKYRILKTTAAKVHAERILRQCDINPYDDRFLIQERTWYGSWKTIGMCWSLEDAKEDILKLKGEHPDQIKYRKAKEQPNEIIGEF